MQMAGPRPDISASEGAIHTRAAQNNDSISQHPMWEPESQAVASGLLMGV